MLRDSIVDMIRAAKEDEDLTGTWFVDLLTCNGKRWAVCAAWVDYSNEKPELTAKIAYQPTNSLMQEYDIDWQMPYDKANGEVYDTELSNVDENDVDWFLSEWDYIKANYLEEV